MNTEFVIKKRNNAINHTIYDIILIDFQTCYFKDNKYK